MHVLRVLLEEGATRAAIHITSAGGCEKVISAMAAHVNKKMIQSEGIMILGLLGGHYRGCRQQILRANGLFALSEAIRVHSDDITISHCAKAVMTILGCNQATQDTLDTSRRTGGYEL